MIGARRAAGAAAILAFAAPAFAGPEVPVLSVDYPGGVIPNAEELVTAAFTSGPGGVTTQCRIVRHSHVPRLDEETCAILKARARFAPGGEQRIVFRWQGPATKASMPSRAQRGDPLLVFPPGNISNDDYPREALERGEDGVVGYDIEVSAVGKPLACRVVQSSGSSALDRTTCVLLVRRGVFLPPSMPPDVSSRGPIAGGSAGACRRGPRALMPPVAGPIWDRTKGSPSRLRAELLRDPVLPRPAPARHRRLPADDRSPVRGA